MTDSAQRGPSRRPSRALPITLTLALAGAWFGVLQVMGYWSVRGADSQRSYYDAALRLARAELQLRAQGLRRCAARLGRLPLRLGQCDAQEPRLARLLASIESRSAGRWSLAGVVNEPWHPADVPVTKPASSQPPAALDYLGLPILYRPGPAPGPREAWVTSSDPLAPEVAELLAGKRAPSSPGPFALSSVFLQRRVSEQQRLDREARTMIALKFGGFVGLLLAGLLITLRWHGRPMRWPGKLSIGFGGALSLLFVLGGAVFTATCYAMGYFRSSSLGRAERLELLDEAVQRGEVPPEVARTARRYIERLPRQEP